jgi:Type VI secretion system/phage-baseplate injector OB domain
MSIPGFGSPVPGNVMPSVKVGKIIGLPLLPTVSDKIFRVVVDTHLHLPDMFEIWFNDQEASVVDDANLSIGSSVEISGAKFGDTSGTTLIKGEVTSIEAICENMSITTIVRGYEKAHRLQRARRSQTFLNMTDSDIARQIASHAGLSETDVDSTSTTHDHIAQVAQTDWEFLNQRAREIGYEVGVVQGKFMFKKAASMPADGGIGGALSAVASAVASALGLGGGLNFKDNLISFRPRLSAANLTPDVEVRFWDGKGARVVSSNSDAASNTAKLDDEPADLADSFTDGLISLPSLPSLPKIPGLPMPDFGSTPSNTAYVVVNRPLASGSNADGAADEMAKGLADAVSSTFAEAEGEAVGDPSIQAGEQVDIKGVPKAFCGKWTVTQARHIFDPEELGYRVHFTVSGRSDRSLFALASGGGTDRRPQFEGLVCGVVTDVGDPDKQGKVKIALPWLLPSFVTDWARVVHLSAGARTGAMFLPEVGDEVLVGFEFGDPRRPYVLGGLVNDNSKFAAKDSAVTSGAVTGRGFASPAGNQLLFTDDLPPGPPGLPPTKSAVTLGTGDGNIALAIDQVAGTVTLSCKPAPPASKTPAGTLTIDCSGAGKIAIKGGAGGVKIESDGQLELSGQLGVKISSSAMVQVQGQMVQLN